MDAPNEMEAELAGLLKANADLLSSMGSMSLAYAVERIKQLTEDVRRLEVEVTALRAEIGRNHKSQRDTTDKLEASVTRLDRRLGKAGVRFEELRLDVEEFRKPLKENGDDRTDT